MLLDAPAENYFIVSRFGAAFTSGLSYNEGTMLPFKEKGTWLTSVLVKGEANKAPFSIFLSVDKCDDCMLSKHNLGTLKIEGLQEENYKVQQVSTGFTVSFTLPFLEFTITGVPPPESWKIAPAEMVRQPHLFIFLARWILMGTVLQAKFSHLNLDIAYLSTADASTLGGILGVTGRDVVPSNVNSGDFEASKFVSEEVLAQV